MKSLSPNGVSGLEEAPPRLPASLTQLIPIRFNPFNFFRTANPPSLPQRVRPKTYGCNPDRPSKKNPLMGFRIPSKELPCRRNDATLFSTMEIPNWPFLQRIIFFGAAKPMAALVPKMLINA
jgi:hypothetical protein